MVKVMLTDELANDILAIRKEIGPTGVGILSRAELAIVVIAGLVVIGRKEAGIEPNIEDMDSVHCIY